MDHIKIIQTHPESLLERSTARALLSDALANDIPKVNALLSAYDVGIVKAAVDETQITAIMRSSFITRLRTQHSMQESVAVWAVDTWIAILSASVLQKLTAEQERSEAERRARLEAVQNSAESLENAENKSEPDHAELATKEDIVDFYTNVKREKVKGKIFVPCGVGRTDNGFNICGIQEAGVSSAPVVFALVYNYLTRNSTILEEDKPHYLRSVKTAVQLNYQRIYRLMIVILQLIKNGHFKTKLDLRYDGNQNELQLAVEIINDYAACFARLARMERLELKLTAPNAKAVKLSLDKKIAGVYVENNHKPNNARELWFGEKINYCLDDSNIDDLEYLLQEISPFRTFKEGQYDALTGMLNANGHAMCIMPTGSGKSLVFYLASLLQPLPIMVLAPTEILIEDQIRNLRKFHHFDNVSHLKLTADNDFRDFRPCTSLIYLTPTTFQSRHLIVKCRHLNEGYEMLKNDTADLLQEVKVAPGSSLAYVVLDEIHCLSNWGHDFRPEYLMLSKYLNKYLSRVSFLGFTATANYTVVDDIQKQLNIPQHNFVSPLQFEKYNYTYHFEAVESTDEMIRRTCEIAAELIHRNERTLIFTKNDALSARLAEEIGFEADVFQDGNADS